MIDFNRDVMDCEECEYYNREDGECRAFECNGVDCPELPCEIGLRENLEFF